MRQTLLIGYGHMGQNHYRVLKKLEKKYNLQLFVCEPDHDKMKGFDYYFPEYNHALQSKKWDYVIITTPTETHAEIIKAAINSKAKNILVEKPIVDNLNNIEISGLTGKRIMVGHIERFNPIIREIKKKIKGKEIDTIICTRSGLKKKEDDWNVDIDLCIHDLDVCHYLTDKGITKISGSVRNNSSNILLKARSHEYSTGEEDVDIFLHADNKSPFKRRMIQIIGDDLFIEGDYMNQKLSVNGKEVNIKHQEPLLVELKYFLEGKYTEEDLVYAIDNIRILRR